MTLGQEAAFRDAILDAVCQQQNPFCLDRPLLQHPHIAGLADAVAPPVEGDAATARLTGQAVGTEGYQLCRGAGVEGAEGLRGWQGLGPQEGGRSPQGQGPAAPADPAHGPSGGAAGAAQ